jgi:F0F1-type ATP synthase assembly protein I
VTQKNGRNITRQLISQYQVAGLAAQSGCLVVGVVLAAIVAGIWLDRALDTRPVFTLALVLGSLPLTIFLLFRLAIRTVSSAGAAEPPPGGERDDAANES